MGQIIKADVNGEEREFEILRGADTSTDVEYVVNSSGDIVRVDQISGNFIKSYTTTKLRLVRKQHEFGGVVFEETGERREVVLGEWFWNGYYPFAATPACLGNIKHIILRPV